MLLAAFAVRDVVLALTLLIEFPAALCVVRLPITISSSSASVYAGVAIVINAPRSISKLEN